MLIVGVRDERPDAEPPAGRDAGAADVRASRPATCSTRLFMDGLYTDLERLSRTNRILEQLGERKLSGTLGALAAAAHARHRAATGPALGRGRARARAAARRSLPAPRLGRRQQAAACSS